LNKLVLTFLSLLVLSASSFAQTKGAFFSEKNVSKDALVEALTPERPSDVKTRSISIQANNPSKSGTRKPAAGAKEAKAALLITFETNSSDLSAAARKSLDIVAQALSSEQLAKHKFDVEGHADSRGNSDENQSLSQARADAVVAYLANKHQFAPERLTALGKGSSQPVNLKNASAPENRRVIFRTQIAGSQ
jgi:OmpA-OmpF porin, OOP family